MQALKGLLAGHAGATAIVTGATGMLGRELINELGRHPETWKTVHALSRSKKGDLPANAVHNHVDFSQSVEQMSRDLKGVEADYVFFSAYLQKDSEEEACRVNGELLDNFLKALEMNNVVSKIKRILLVTGGKIYGVHLGRVKVPMVESDPWLPEPPYPPNFYTVQIHILQEFCKKHPNVSWTTTLPNDVIGYVRGNFMNLITGVGYYAAVCKELGAPFLFPGGRRFYEGYDSFSSSRLHAEFCLWAVLTPEAANQTFNIVNGDIESWSNIWPKIAQRYGLTIPANQFDLPVEAAYTDMPLFESPPINLSAAERGLGHIPASKLERRVDLVKWAEKPEVKEAWARVAKRQGLHDEFGQATWFFINFVLGRNYDLIISMSKARKMGWTGYEDSWESFEHTFDALEADKLLPKRVT
ncbi:NAD dependent epimerase/dehydratase family protein [Auriculariales sp. MPI-PUGE-AT-0066]|nr:NAD dependent epimerase/dehydratase family protein [Auriculariales sp. MPI-PUGE-AT-0066]